MKDPKPSEGLKELHAKLNKPNQDNDAPQENPLNPLREMYITEGMKVILAQLISGANGVGATSVTIEALEKKLEELSDE